MRVEKPKDKYYVLRSGNFSICFDLFDLDLWKQKGSREEIQEKEQAVAMLESALERDDRVAISKAAARLRSLGYKFSSHWSPPSGKGPVLMCPNLSD